VRGTTVCVEVVEREEDDEEEDVEGAGEAEREHGDEEEEGFCVDDVGGVGVRDGDGGRRAAIVSLYSFCKDAAKRLRLSCGSSLSYCKNSFAYSHSSKRGKTCKQ